ncbi:ABC transporter substrate-binding protein [Marinovum sp.]|uniref:ABC transporter substrate-binding protein n=1 Tax=Marinovum sp. TaxID=2024839 RepID=UPI002B278658|nr:extracellular solute-binding protein [Marinovum sp.]
MALRTAISRIARVGALSLGAAALAGSAGAVDLTMWTLVENDNPEFIAEAAEAFKQTHPDVNIIHETFPNEAYKTQIQVALTGSDAPDVFFNWAGEDAARLVRDDLVLDITEYKDVDGGFGEYLGEGWLSSFEYDGRNYGVPAQAVSKYFYYNVPFFEEHGLTPPDTFDGLLTLCQDIRAVDPDIVPWALGNSERWKLNHVITMLNARVLGTEATAEDYALTASDEELFADPGYVEAWQKVVDLQDAGCFQDAPNATSPEASRSMFAAEISPLIYCGSWCANIFNDEGFEDFAMFRMPGIEGGAGDPGAGFMVPSGYQISASTEHPEMAAAWVSFLVSDEMSLRFAEVVGGIPSNPALIDQFKGSENFKWISEDMATATGSVNVLDVLLEASVANAYLDAGVEVLNRTKTPEEAMADIRAVALDAKAALNAN